MILSNLKDLFSLLWLSTAAKYSFDSIVSISIGEIDLEDHYSESRPRYRVLLANDDTFQLLMINRVLGLFSEFFERIENS